MPVARRRSGLAVGRRHDSRNTRWARGVVRIDPEEDPPFAAVASRQVHAARRPKARGQRSRGRRCRPSRPRRRRGPCTGSLPVSAAASATAPPGSTTSLNSRNAISIASSTSSSRDDEARPEQLLGEREGDVARRRRQQRVADRAARAWRSSRCCRCASERARSSKPAGSPACTLVPGLSALDGRARCRSTGRRPSRARPRRRA